MDATLKESSVPSISKIQYFLSPLSRCGISNLNIAVSPLPLPPCRALCQPNYRIFSRRLSSRFIIFVGDNRRRARKKSLLTLFVTSSPTCLNPSCSLRSEEFSSLRRSFDIFETEHRLHQESSITIDSETIPCIKSSSSQEKSSHHLPRATTTVLTIRWAEEEFFTHSVFTHAWTRFRRTFDAHEDFTKTDQRRTIKESHNPLTIVVFCIDIEHIDRLRPQTPNSRIQFKIIEQCHAALPHSLCRVSDLE